MMTAMGSAVRLRAAEERTARGRNGDEIGLEGECGLLGDLYPAGKPPMATTVCPRRGQPGMATTHAVNRGEDRGGQVGQAQWKKGGDALGVG